MPRSSIKEESAAERVNALQQSFAEVVRNLRLNRRYSQEEFAERSGLHRTYISDIERGSRNIAFANIIRIADALEISASKLISMAERNCDL